MDRLLLL